MKSLKIAIILVALAFATAIGCGSDNGSNPDAPVITGTGGTTRLDAGLGGASGSGGSTVVDAPISTGGTPGVDAGPVKMDGASIDVPMGVDAVVAEAGGGEAGPATNVCTGLSATACDQAIRNAAVDNTVTAQEVTGTTPPSYSVCSQ